MLPRMLLSVLSDAHVYAFLLCMYICVYMYVCVYTYIYTHTETKLLDYKVCIYSTLVVLTDFYSYNYMRIPGTPHAANTSTISL